MLVLTSLLQSMGTYHEYLDMLFDCFVFDGVHLGGMMDTLIQALSVGTKRTSEGCCTLFKGDQAHMGKAWCQKPFTYQSLVRGTSTGSFQYLIY